MKRHIRIDAVKKTYINPIILDVSKKVFRGLGASPAFIFTLNNMSVKNDTFESREEVHISISDISRDMGSIMRGKELYKDYPIFRKKNIGFTATPVYSPRAYDITFTVITTSRTVVNELVDNLNNIKRGGMVHLFEGEGNFTIPMEVTDRLKDINKCRTESGLIPKSDEDYIAEIATNRVSVTSNMSEQSDALIVSEKQTGITLTLKPSINNKVEHTKEDAIYKYEFEASIEFQAPLGIEVIFEPLVYNRFISAKFLPRDVVGENLEDYAYYRDELIKMFKASTYPDTTIKDGLFQDGILKGYDVGDDNVNGKLSDFPKLLKTIDDLYFIDGYPTDETLSYDLGFIFSGKLSSLPKPQLISELDWSVENGLVESGPFTGWQMSNAFTGKLDGYFYNNVVYEGLLDTFVAGNNLGGVAISGPQNLPFVVGGLLSNKVISSIDVSLPYSIDGVRNSNGLVVGGFLDGKFLNDKQLQLFPNIDMERLAQRNVVNKNAEDISYDYNFINIPTYDKFNIEGYEATIKLLSIMIQREPTKPKHLLSLNDLGAYKLDDLFINMIRDKGNSNNLTQLNQFPLLFEVYDSIDGLVSPDKVSFNKDTMSLYLENDLEINRTYRVVIHVLADYGNIWDEGIRELMYDVVGKQSFVHFNVGHKLIPARSRENINRPDTFNFRDMVASITLFALRNKTLVKEMLWR